MVEHRLVEVGGDVGGACRPASAPDARVTTPVPAAVSRNGARRKSHRTPSNVVGILLEDQRDEVTVIVFRDRTGEDLVGFQHGISHFIGMVTYRRGATVCLRGTKDKREREGLIAARAAASKAGARPAAW